MLRKALQGIFSVKNCEDKKHKLITIVGLKLKIRDYNEEINHKKLDQQIKNFKRNGICKSNRTKQIIVSLTSFPERMKDIHYTIYSLLNQSLKPDKVVLWLGDDKFPNKEQDLPDKLLALKKNGLTIKWCKDLRSYTKLIPALKEFPSDIIVTADDDIYYPSNWLKLLYKEYLKNPNDIICHRAHNVLIDDNGNILPYKKWEKAVRVNNSSYTNFLTGVGGVLYPPKSLHPDVFKEDLFSKLCPYADDIWFYAMAVHNNTKIRVVKHNLYRLTYTNLQRELGNTNEQTLIKINAFQNKNDPQFQNVINYYPDILKKIKENTINIVFITDNNYVSPTYTAINSIKSNKSNSRFYQIYIIADEVSSNNKKLLKRLNEYDFNIKIIDYKNEYKNLEKENFHVSTAALAKFNIMNILPHLDKVLYLDSDVIVQNNLVDLYDMDLEERYAAVVKDIAPILLYKPSILKKLNLDHKCYFNSGVMLLNLKQLREDKLNERLIDYKQNGINFFMDQDALNVCFKENVKYLNLKYNYIITIPQRFKWNTIKRYYDEDKKININNAYIVHLASPFKPWNNYVPQATKLFFRYSKGVNLEGINPELVYRYNNPAKYFIKQIFSIKNSEIHKIITICGVKIKLKNKWLMINKQINNIQYNLDYEFLQQKEIIQKIQNSYFKEIEVLNNMYKSLNLSLNELLFSTILNQSWEDSEWVKNKNFTLINGAANYSFIYVLYRILNDITPNNILEFGLGQTSKLTTQYINNKNQNAMLDIIEHDSDWINLFSQQIDINNNIKIIQKDLEKFKFNGVESDKYSSLDDVILNKQYDLIIIDGPSGVKKVYPRTNILDLIPNNLANNFIIILDDAERDGEKNTAQLIFQKLNENDIKYVKFYKYALKTQLIIASENYKYLRWY